MRPSCSKIPKIEKSYLFFIEKFSLNQRKAVQHGSNRFVALLVVQRGELVYAAGFWHFQLTISQAVQEAEHVDPQKPHIKPTDFL